MNRRYVYSLKIRRLLKNIYGRERTRMLVRIRDEFTCKDCGDERTPKQAKELKKRLFDIHHLSGLCGKKSRGYDKISEIDGLVTLCHKCHFNRPEHITKKSKLKRNVPRNKKIIKLKNSGISTLKIASRFKITKQRVSQIVLEYSH